PFLEQPNPAWAVWLYFQQLGEKPKALDMARRSFEKSKGGPLTTYLYAMSLYEQGSVNEAINCLEQRRQSDFFGDVLRAYLLAEAVGKHAALAEYNKLAQMYLKESGLSLGGLLLFLGEKEKAEADFQRSRPALAISQDWKAFNEAEHLFRSGKL